MPVSEKLKAPFLPNKFYHIVFKSIDDILLFREDKDYIVFLKRYSEFLEVGFETWAYSLLPNHAHFIIKVKPLEIILENLQKIEEAEQTVSMKKLLGSMNAGIIFDEMLERQINSFMVSFANYYKNKYGHHGGLFQKPFKRIWIDSESYLQQAIVYVHANPVKHRVCKEYTIYPHSSYQSFINNTSTDYVIKNVLDFFGGLHNFIQQHTEQVRYYYQKGFPNSKLE